MQKTKTIRIDGTKVRISLPYRRIIWAESYEHIEAWIRRGIVEEIIQPVVGNVATVDWFIAPSYNL